MAYIHYTVMKVNESKDTRLLIKKTTRTKLKGMKRGGETYDTLINRLMKTEKKTLMKWTHDDVEHTMRNLYDLDPSPEDVENVAGLIDWDCARGHEQVRQAVEEYLATKEAEDKEGIAP